jgi:hypothetical protein
MRLVCVLVSAILLICLSVQAFGIEPGEIAVPSIRAPNMDMPDPRPKPLVKPDNSADLILNQSGNISIDQTQTTQTPPEEAPMDVSGRWSIKFDEGRSRSLDLNLWSSSGNRIIGYGNLREGGTQHSVTVSGSVIGQELTLATKSATPEYAHEKNDEYRLELFMANNTLSGTYVLMSGGQSLGNGNATAVKL